MPRKVSGRYDRLSYEVLNKPPIGKAGTESVSSSLLSLLSPFFDVSFDFFDSLESLESFDLSSHTLSFFSSHSFFFFLLTVKQFFSEWRGSFCLQCLHVLSAVSVFPLIPRVFPSYKAVLSDSMSIFRDSSTTSLCNCDRVGEVMEFRVEYLCFLVYIRCNKSINII